MIPAAAPFNGTPLTTTRKHHDALTRHVEGAMACKTKGKVVFKSRRRQRLPRPTKVKVPVRVGGTVMW